MVQIAPIPSTGSLLDGIPKEHAGAAGCETLLVRVEPAAGCETLLVRVEPDEGCWQAAELLGQACDIESAR
jgi:hypothetical protein